MRSYRIRLPRIAGVLLSAVSCLAGLHFAALTLAAQEPALVDVTGNWLIHSTDWDGHKADKTVQLRQNGNQVTGHFKGPNQSGGLSGFVNGRHIAFTTKTRHQLHFRGMVDGDTISGNWGIEGRVGEWTAIRTSPIP